MDLLSETLMLGYKTKEYVGGAIEDWHQFLRGKRHYEDETHREYMRRMSNWYHVERLNEKVLDRLSGVDSKLTSLINRAVMGFPVKENEALMNIAEAVSIPPPPLNQRLPPTLPPPARVDKSNSLRDQLVQELKIKLYERQQRLGPI